MTAPAETTFDIRDIPFSRRGSWLDISPVVGLHDTRRDLHLVSHQTGMHAVLRLEPLRNGEPVPVDIETSPARLRLTAPGASIEVVFQDDSTLRLRGRMLDLRLADAAARLTPFTGTYLFRDPIDGAAVFTSYETGRRYRVTTLAGTVTVVGAELLGAGERAVIVGGDEWEVAVEEFEAARAPFSSNVPFDDAARANARDFDDYADRVAPWRSERTPGAVTAAYVLWSATVSPRGFLGARPS